MMASLLTTINIESVYISLMPGFVADLCCAVCRPCLQDKKRGGIYEAPCYRVKNRKGFNYITSFALRTEDDKSKWILRGAALLGSMD
jgi:hypothetical protein